MRAAGIAHERTLRVRALASTFLGLAQCPLTTVPVIASVAKQSRVTRDALDCFPRLEAGVAMTGRQGSASRASAQPAASRTTSEGSSSSWTALLRRSGGSRVLIYPSIIAAPAQAGAQSRAGRDHAMRSIADICPTGPRPSPG